MQLKVDYEGNEYFLSDKIFSIQNDKWQRLNFPVAGKIYQFHPVNPRDIWLSVNQETYTCLLYHYHEGITENIQPPFSNFITAMYFPNKDFGILASDVDIAIYSKGEFVNLKPSPTRGSINKLYGTKPDAFWAASFMGELYHYKGGQYIEFFKGAQTTDITFINSELGYALVGDRLEEITPEGSRLLHRDSRFKQLKSITLLPDRSLLMAGAKGLMLEWKNGELKLLPRACEEDLAGICATSDGIWAAGNNGRLLYAGQRKFVSYTEEGIGFSSGKLVNYGVEADDEYGVAIADFNGDKRKDIYSVCIYNLNRLYMNNLSGQDRLSALYGFSDEAESRNATGVSVPGTTNAFSELKLGVTTADADNDGDPDLYISYLNGSNKFLLNNGEGVFRNVADQLNRACDDMNRSNAGAFADIDNDGDLDLFVTSEQGSNRLFLNDGTAHFTDVTKASGLSSISGGMCASFSDINNDGLPDLCVSFWYPCNRLYINESGSGKVHFRDITVQTDLSLATPSKSNAVVFADVNNDGNMDLFIANRNTPNKLYINPGNGMMQDQSSRYFQSKALMSNGAAFADFDLDGYQDLYLTNVGENILFRNLFGKSFEDVTAVYGAEASGYGTGCAVGDMDNDGDIDFYAANYINGNSQLFLNISGKVNSAVFELKGTKSNRDAIGAKFWLYRTSKDKVKPDSLCAFREISGGGGYSSCSSKEIIVGLDAARAYYAVIFFPASGDSIRVDGIKSGERYLIEEQKGSAAFLTLSRKWIFRLFYDRENRPEIAKILFLVLLTLLYARFSRKINRQATLIKWSISISILLISLFINRYYLFSAYSVAFFIAPLLAFGLMLILHLYIELFLVRRMALKEKQDLREKLSRDLHDDLASTLGSISIYANSLAKQGPAAVMDKQVLSEKVNSLTQDALQSISDIIWMTSPRNDSLQSLLAKTCNQMQEIFSESGVEFSYHIAVPEEYVILPEKLRNDAFLILKEGAHNIIKHAAATKVEFRAVVDGKDCDIFLRDNGAGFDKLALSNEDKHQGNGLLNMNKRASESGIMLKIDSTPGSGTKLQIHFRI
ncbi:MAG: VCBS repeat-containing protein [Bacteroidales bacterium]|nr:VCBS repeat-containing protein [Bacteroidales bacterium]